MAWRPFRNFGLKVAALGLGAVLWFTVSGEQVERSLQVPLAFRNLSPGLALMDRPAAVDVRVRGGATEIMGLRSTDISVIADLADREPGEAVILLRADRVAAPSGVEVTQITPSTVTVRLESLRTLNVPVQVTTQGQPAVGFVLGGFSVMPATVEVIGPVSRLRTPVVAVTEPVLVGGATADVVQTVGVGVTDEDIRLVEPTEVEVTVYVEVAPAVRTIEARLVGHRNLASGLEAVVEPDTVAVVVRGRSSTLDALDVSTVLPYVDLAGVGPGSHEIEVNVDLPVGSMLVRVQPVTVLVRVR
jgi:hypothetical protein